MSNREGGDVMSSDIGSILKREEEERMRKVDQKLVELEGRIDKKLAQLEKRIDEKLSHQDLGSFKQD
jgi:hypothetical protein